MLYTTAGLPVGNITNRDWAIVVTRAYNDWVLGRYLKRSPRFNAMGLIPMQEPEAAVEPVGEGGEVIQNGERVQSVNPDVMIDPAARPVNNRADWAQIPSSAAPRWSRDERRLHAGSLE